MDAAWDSASELDGGTSCTSVVETIVDEDEGGMLMLSEAVACEDCCREPSSEDLIDEEDGSKEPLLSATGALGLPGGAVCVDCALSLGGTSVEDGDAGALSLGLSPLILPGDASGEMLGGADDSLETGQTVV